MAETLTNQSGLDIELCQEPMRVLSNEVEATELALTVTKTQSCDFFVVGGTIRYCVEIKNESGVEITPIRWFDDLDNRLSYIADTFTVDGSPETPTINGQELSWDIGTLAGNQTVNICFKVTVGPA